MKRHSKLPLSVTALLTAVCIACNGCSSAEGVLQDILNKISTEPYVSSEARTYNDAVDRFFAALDAKDAQAVREMFSQKVQEEDADLEEQIGLLLAGCTTFGIKKAVIPKNNCPLSLLFILKQIPKPLYHCAKQIHEYLFVP